MQISWATDIPDELCQEMFLLLWMSGPPLKWKLLEETEICQKREMWWLPLTLVLTYDVISVMILWGLVSCTIYTIGNEM